MKILGRRSPAAATLFVVLVLAVLAALLACGGGGFDPQSKVDSVRLFVVKADKPYAKPGETVTLEALLTDARRERPRAAKLYWIPILCLNPQDDLYYLCFANPGDASNQAGATRLIPLGSFADAGAGAGADGGAAAGGNPFAASRPASISGRSSRRDRPSRSACRMTRSRCVPRTPSIPTGSR